MGLFGDKAMKQLDRKLESGWMALEFGAGAGRVELTVNNIGNELLAAANGLARDGRAADAAGRLIQAKRGGDDPLTGLWNELLEKVAAEL